jgi:hypothetical protein
MEEWRDCSGFRNSYQVSNLGRVRNEVKILSANYCGEYLAVSMDNSRRYIHRVVAAAFLPNPDGLPEIDHINRIKEDNRVENLRWVSKSGNAVNREKRETQSGYNNIRRTKEGTWRVDIRRKGFQFRKTFKTLQEAIQARNKYSPEV